MAFQIITGHASLPHLDICGFLNREDLEFLTVSQVEKLSVRHIVLLKDDPQRLVGIVEKFYAARIILASGDTNQVFSFLQITNIPNMSIIIIILVCVLTSPDFKGRTAPEQIAVVVEPDPKPFVGKRIGGQTQVFIDSSIANRTTWPRLS